MKERHLRLLIDWKKLAFVPVAGVDTSLALIESIVVVVKQVSIVELRLSKVSCELLLFSVVLKTEYSLRDLRNKW